MVGQDIINFIKEHNLEEAEVTVTATMYYPGDHICQTTNEVSILEDSKYIGKGKSIPTINFYVDNNLY